MSQTYNSAPSAEPVIDMRAAANGVLMSTKDAAAFDARLDARFAAATTQYRLDQAAETANVYAASRAQVVAQNEALGAQSGTYITEKGIAVANKLLMWLGKPLEHYVHFVQDHLKFTIN